MAQVTINDQGRVTLPATLRKELGFKPGETIAAYVDDNRLILESRESVLARIQAEFARCVPEGVSLVDELHKQRQWEAEKEREWMEKP